ncbi:MAG: hypothetical protein PUK85_07030 [Clostridia bacterium]|nr:hypothetical protein [Clostridia bacterium]MDY5558385.1 hypothetical protein [Candidatus Heritagella sp.]
MIFLQNKKTESSGKNPLLSVCSPEEWERNGFLRGMTPPLFAAPSQQAGKEFLCFPAQQKAALRHDDETELHEHEEMLCRKRAMVFPFRLCTPLLRKHDASPVFDLFTIIVMRRALVKGKFHVLAG